MRFSEDDTILKDLVYLKEEAEVGAGTPLERARRAVWGMLYADDAGVVSKSQEGLTRMMTTIVEVFGEFGLTVCMVITYSRVWINGVRLSILLVVSWTRKIIFPCLSPCVPENLVSRDGFKRFVPR